MDSQIGSSYHVALRSKFHLGREPSESLIGLLLRDSEQRV